MNKHSLKQNPLAKILLLYTEYFGIKQMERTGSCRTRAAPTSVSMASCMASWLRVVRSGGPGVVDADRLEIGRTAHREARAGANAREQRVDVGIGAVERIALLTALQRLTDANPDDPKRHRSDHGHLIRLVPPHQKPEPRASSDDLPRLFAADDQHCASSVGGDGATHLRTGRIKNRIKKT